MCVLRLTLLLFLASGVCLADIADRRSDTWAAIDGVGRVLPDSSSAREKRNDKFVGIFYFLWLGEHNRCGETGPYDVTKILQQDPNAMQDWDNPLWGPDHPEGFFHYWSEPLFGYYQGSDPWVMRKHAEMLVDAGVDVVIFDVSNGFVYEENYLALCKTWSQMRNEGEPTPQIAFLCPFWDPLRVIPSLYNKMYSKGLYKDLWFYWKGKPLILADFNIVKDENDYADFFTFRRPEASYFNKSTSENSWSWLETYPQNVYYNDKKEPEQMCVGVGQNAANGKLCAFSEANTYGRSYHNGATDTSKAAVKYGLNFQEQWNHALEADPDFVFITGWNEWIAIRHNNFHNSVGKVQFVDCYSMEKSRDIEPMKGGFGDNYYYQMAGNIRRFKGVREPDYADNPTTINLWSDWSNIKLTYLDSSGDTAYRDYGGVQKAGRYINYTGRNDFVVLKVAHDDNNIYFFAETRDKLTPSTDESWMVLLIDADNNPKTGWHGFDYRVNKARYQNNNSFEQLIEPSSCTVELYGNGLWHTTGDSAYKTDGNKLQIVVSRDTLGMSDKLAFNFKWSDNMQNTDDPMDFIVNGDTAPNGRFAYRYIER